jgi:cyanophycinase-like exopeptidase
MVSELVFGEEADVFAVDLTRKGNRTSAIRQALAGADLVFLSGGDVELGMRAFEERDLPAYIRRLAAEGKPMEGLSAGSILLGMHWVRFSGEDESVAELFPCLGVVPASFDTHGEAEGWDELRALAAAVPDTASERVVYGIPSGGAAVFDGDIHAAGAPLARFLCGHRPRRLRDLAPACDRIS